MGINNHSLMTVLVEQPLALPGSVNQKVFEFLADPGKARSCYTHTAFIK